MFQKIVRERQIFGASVEGSRNKRVTRVAKKRTVDLLKFDAEYGANTVCYVTGVNLQ